MIIQIALAILSVILIISVFLSLIKNDYWLFRILEYPRLQKLILINIVAVSWVFFWPITELFYQIILAALLLSIFYLIYKIWPYTSLSKKEMVGLKSADHKNELKIFSANVLQENRAYSKLIEQIRSADPDIIFLLETNSDWSNALKELEKEYPNGLALPLENTYGLLFRSRLKLENAQINFLVKHDIPSIDVVVVLPSGKKVQIWGLHPEPPVPTESLRSTAKDKELMKIAFKAKETPMPCVVIGDLNDVAWSYTTELFRKTSELLDPRRGRGFYSTFSAHHWLIRFPLDYVFCSAEFGLIKMKRMPKNGSDHFATLTHLYLQNGIQKAQHPPSADQNEMKKAKEIASQ